MAARNALIDAFAEALSLRGDVKRASHDVGVQPAYGRVLLQRIINRLGRDQCK